MSRRVVVVALVAACGGGEVDRPTVFGGDRPVTLDVPPSLTGADYPLVLILHGYGFSGFFQKAYLGLDDVAARDDAFVLAPDGLIDSTGKQFWNADPSCCDFEHRNPDDVAYLGGLLDDVMRAWPIDPRRVRVIGHSNGGFMTYRMACERADVITSVVVLAGDAVSVPCNPTESVHVLHIHGTQDDTVSFAGAAPSVAEWAAHNGCGDGRVPGEAFDLDAAVDGAETETTTVTGCPVGGRVEQWTLNGSGHVPNLTAAFDAPISQWWTDHPRP